MCWGHQPNLTRTCLRKSVTHVTPKASLVILWHILAHAKISSFRQTWVRTGRFWYFRERFSFLCLKHDMLAIIQGHNHDIDTTNIFPKTKLHQSLDRKDHHLVLQKESYTYSYVDWDWLIKTQAFSPVKYLENPTWFCKYWRIKPMSIQTSMLWRSKCSLNHTC